jgi:cytochrome c5
MHWFLLLVIAIAAGCTEVEDCAPVPPAQELLMGQRVYEDVCADCHEQGVDGAPAVGDRGAWAGRSCLWVAVLEEHAKDGYLKMPAKGGDSSLSDQEVSAAAQYMLTLTHPDWQSE